MIIDAHQHFWTYELEKHGWINDDMAVIRKDFTPEELVKVYRENDIDGCVAVQADQTTEETDFLLGLSTEHDFIKGVVGWVDFRAKEINEDLERYSHYKKIKGFRHVVQGEPDHNFLLRKDFIHGISKLDRYGFTFDILIFPHQLGAALEFVKNSQIRNL